MMLMGGNAILEGTMTLGDLVSYVFFTGTLAAPMVQISANIGTQITEAFAGLDRIRELRQIATEDDEDAEREPLARAPRATSPSTTCGSSTRRISPCCGASPSTRRPGRRRRWWAPAARARAPPSAW